MTADSVVQPASLELKITRWMVWIFCFAFAFDFRATVSAGSTGGSTSQILFLLLALGSFSVVVFLGWRHLLVRPTCYLLMLWWGFLGYLMVITVLNSVDLGRFIRVIIPLLLCATGMTVAHIASCQGMRAREIIKPLILAAVVNIIWRIIYGFAFKGVSLETARVEILSPALNWSFAFVGCSIMFRKKLRLTTIIVAAAAFTSVFLSVTRGLLFPMLASALMCVFCLLLALRWKILPFSWIPKKAIPLAAFTLILGVAIVGVSLAAPGVLDRWTERLFHHGGDITSKDLSWLTREAEAVAMIDILSEEPTSFVYGKGVGASYYWDPSYYPELWLVYPADYDFSMEMWFAGHSVWTYALFSGGAIGVGFILAVFVTIMALSLRGVYLNRQWPGFDLYLGFLPFVAAWCLLSESVTSNPFDERLMGVLLGVMGGLSQDLFNRARRMRLYQAAPQTIMLVAHQTALPADRPIAHPAPAFSASEKSPQPKTGGAVSWHRASAPVQSTSPSVWPSQGRKPGSSFSS